MIKKLFTVAIVTSMFVCACATTLEEDEIHINGEIEETIEVNTEYVEKGVTYPESKYTLVTTGQVLTNVLGRYELIYSLYTNEGEFSKELHRFVSVVDKTAPTCIEAQTISYYAGITYNLSSFVSDYSDNYNSKEQIVVSNDSFVFTSPGTHKFEVDFYDSSNNQYTFKKNIDVLLDPVKLIEFVYKNQPYKVTNDTNGIGNEYTRVNIDSNSSFTYYHGSTMHYSQRVSSSLGNYASISLSAEYGYFDDADLTYHISGIGSSYSVGFANINATSESVTVSSFRSTINNLNLDQSDMLSELNLNLPSVLANFHSYFSDILHLDLE